MAQRLRVDREKLPVEPLPRLEEIAASVNSAVPPWLRDLVVNGPRYEQWPLPSGRPSRMELTEFLARWLKASGVSQEHAVAWLMDFTFQVLAPFAKTGPSGLRHGTKANTRWVYNSDFHFDFVAMASDPLEPEWAGKPAYMPVYSRWHKLLPLEKERARQLRAQAPRAPALLPVKQRYREKFEEGLKLAREKRAAGETVEGLVELLNAAGYPTRTGRKWTRSTLALALKRG